MPEPPNLENLNSDMFFDFHMNEKNIKDDLVPVKTVIEDETFAGYKDLLGGDNTSTIKSAKGTVRGVRNRVRAGIATFLQINSTEKVSYMLITSTIHPILHLETVIHSIK